MIYLNTPTRNRIDRINIDADSITWIAHSSGGN